MFVLSAPRIALAILVAVQIGSHASAASFTYDQHFSPLGEISAESELPIVLANEGPLVYGHGMYGVTYCSDKRFQCIQSEVFSFAVPVADSMRLGDEWRSGGETYTVIREAKGFELLGSTFDAYLISRPIDEAWEAQFLYSRDRGLVAFATVSLRSGTYGFIAWLRDECGLFALECPNGNE